MVDRTMIDNTIVAGHATPEQLLDIKDGVVLDVSDHVNSCPQCQQELKALSEIGQSIGQALFDNVPQAQADTLDRVWQRVNKASKRDRESDHQGDVRLVSKRVMAEASNKSRFQLNSLSTAVYTLAVSILLTGLIGLYSNQQQGSIEQQTQMLQASIDELMLNSRGLESVLQQVASQHSDLTPVQRRAADRLYWRLSYLDQMISEKSGVNRPDSEPIKALWGDRIDALTELNQLYSNEQQVVPGIPEI